MKVRKTRGSPTKRRASEEAEEVLVLQNQWCLLVARRFPVISLREITAEDLGSSRKSTIWLLLDPVFGLFPCIFPTDLGFAPRDGFATDWNLRQDSGAAPPNLLRGFRGGGIR